MKKGKLKIKNILIAILILLLIIFGAIKYIIHINTDEYKLKQIGYSKQETYLLKENLNQEQIDIILEKEYSNTITDLIQEKYFLFKNLDTYLEYCKTNKNTNITDVITKINTNTHLDYYTNIKSTDLSKDTLALLNKYYKVDADYEPEDLVNMSLSHAYSGHKTRQIVYTNYMKMCSEAKKDGYTLVTISSYRTNSFQEALYNDYANKNSVAYADSISARPGHSEHQLGLALDIVSINSGFGGFEETEEYLWLKDNAHKYGFIVRYPEEKEEITGYSFEPWHYRYVGVEVATYIYENNITFDEYYAFYIE
ncbi:MAG: M15 family metallopeptidase [Bacilli bacterium]|nr:M15 family metallopeptidase [Bacilli bacterium]